MATTSTNATSAQSCLTQLFEPIVDPKIIYNSLVSGAVFCGISYATGGAAVPAAIIGAGGSHIKQFLEITIFGRQGDNNQRDSSWAKTCAKWTFSVFSNSAIITGASLVDTAIKTGEWLAWETLSTKLVSTATGVVAGQLACHGSQHLMDCLGIETESKWRYFVDILSTVMASRFVAGLTQSALNGTLEEQMLALTQNEELIDTLSQQYGVPPDELKSHLSNTAEINRTAEAVRRIDKHELQRFVRQTSDLRKGNHTDNGNNINNGTDFDATNVLIGASATTGGLMTLVICCLCCTIIYQSCSNPRSRSRSSSLDSRSSLRHSIQEEPYNAPPRYQDIPAQDYPAIPTQDYQAGQPAHASNLGNSDRSSAIPDSLPPSYSSCPPYPCSSNATVRPAIPNASTSLLESQSNAYGAVSSNTTNLTQSQELMDLSASHD